ncbi:MAG TPA: hypothetical protein VKP66_13375 [Steroidobacteraceae bacterium]|nr:hypothetical protein [Steroidobacteraceae bacterium]
MYKLASVALSAALGVAGVSQSVPAEAHASVSIGVALPGVAVVAPYTYPAGYYAPYYYPPRYYAPRYYAPYYAPYYYAPYYYRHGRYWHRDYDRDRYEHRHWDHDGNRWDRR